MPQTIELDPAATPQDIENRSFAIIDAEIPEPRPFQDGLWQVARRCVHTLGDTEILADLRLSGKGLAAWRPCATAARSLRTRAWPPPVCPCAA